MLWFPVPCYTTSTAHILRCEVCYAPSNDLWFIASNNCRICFSLSLRWNRWICFVRRHWCARATNSVREESRTFEWMKKIISMLPLSVRFGRRCSSTPSIDGVRRRIVISIDHLSSLAIAVRVVDAAASNAYEIMLWPKTEIQIQPIRCKSQQLEASPIFGLCWRTKDRMLLVFFFISGRQQMTCADCWHTVAFTVRHPSVRLRRTRSECLHFSKQRWFKLTHILN